MSVAQNQQRILLGLLARLRPHWRRDRNLPARIQSLIAANRAFGSRDRRLYRELIYTALRYLPWIEPALENRPDLAVRAIAWLAADSPATATFRQTLVADWPPCPPHLEAKVADLAQRLGPPLGGVLPEWFREHCPEAFEPEQTDALLRRAPLWLRLQTDDEALIDDEFRALGWQLHRSPALPGALRLLDEVDVTKSSAFRDGLIEIQDLGSQLLLEAAAITSGERWLDACAGAGGKTLQLARLLGPAGRIDAHDIRADALRELAARAARAGIPVAPPDPAMTADDVVRRLPAPRRHEPPLHPSPAAPITLVEKPAGDYDGVLVDAPCSGSGTWRRAPHLKWTTTPQMIADAATRQRDLLDRFSRHVRPGGRLIYATCSLSRHENEDVVAAFLDAHRDFAAVEPAKSFGFSARAPGLTILPARHDTDGFFVASLRRT
jgi:16S rRNA (cytosine967-C5)-methyltransferase